MGNTLSRAPCRVAKTLGQPRTRAAPGHSGVHGTRKRRRSAAAAAGRPARSPIGPLFLRAYRSYGRARRPERPFPGRSCGLDYPDQARQVRTANPARAAQHPSVRQNGLARAGRCQRCCIRHRSRSVQGQKRRADSAGPKPAYTQLPPPFVDMLPRDVMPAHNIHNPPPQSFLRHRRRLILGP